MQDYRASLRVQFPVHDEMKEREPACAQNGDQRENMVVLTEKRVHVAGIKAPGM
jgi:hypothetical protein